MDIYLVEIGAYSDRYIAGAFSKRDDADAYARRHEGHVLCVTVDEEQFDEETRRFLRPGEHSYHVAMAAGGNDAEAEEMWTDPQDYLNVWGNNERFTGECWASSEEHAIKIVNDRRTQWLAIGMGREPIKDHFGGNNFGWAKALFPADVANA